MARPTLPPHRGSEPEAPQTPAPTVEDAALPELRPAPSWSLPVRLPAIGGGIVVFAHLLAAFVVAVFPQDWARSPLTVLLLSGVICVPVTLGVFWQLGQQIGRRIDRISDVLERTQHGDYSRRVKEGECDDVGLLARRVNRLVGASERRERRMMESALTDPLTGLPNRALLSERIRHSLAVSRRTRGKFAVAVLDLDRFKAINDTLGHAAGDTVLREVALRLRTVVRDSDTIARLGGDEFVMLLQGGEDAAQEVGWRIIEAFKKPLHFRDQRIDIGVSIGVAIHPEHGEDDLSLLRHADMAMYRAKRRRAGVEIFDGESHEVRRSYLSMLGEMRSALEAGQFVLDYQPKLDLSTGLIVGLEGLVRWNHPTRGRVSPAEFIPFAEQTGFMRHITRWVVREGARFASELARRDMTLNVSVNVSAQDIEDAGFSGGITTVVAEHRLAPGRFTLEITESGLLSESPTALGNLKAIADSGVRLAVDDFGTGYATLKQLQQLPVHELKIDRSFVSGMNHNRGNQSIVKATIDLGKQLGLRVTAEGVETIAELRALAAMGCDEAQGYYLSKAMDANEVVAWVEMRHALYASSRDAYFRTMVKP